MTALLEREPDAPLPLIDPEADELPPVNLVKAGLTLLVVIGPLVALAGVIVNLWGHGVGLRDVLIGAGTYVVVGHGVTVGYHRLFAHRAFKANRPLKIALALAGSLALEGGVVAWVANHRCHHAHTDRPGDPHSPLRGFWHAHVGWMLRPLDVSPERYAPDIVADRDLRVINALFPVAAVATFAIPFALGWLFGGTFAAAMSALLWAGVIRIGVLHHATWSINSICHTFGRRPFRTGDRSSNVGALALLAMGESWHNAHHAFPASARHGVDRGQLDTSAFLIRVFERAGWAQGVRWPDAARLETKRI
jgi:stearoyl-CoA desaturase (delta-9 desaturase)